MDKVGNASLGFAGASRAATKRPMPPETLKVHLAIVAALDPGVAMVLELKAEFGLHAEEGVRSVTNPTTPALHRLAKGRNSRLSG
ncbi:integrase domain-containing protein [Paraburkholderia hiiakae]|uniref:integrase domain-containing protein n=1 Tax=Paraburkholderia hiiakae TaxID=1081782 RepID=UPI001918D085|nr:integrase domain-containing protein [Paraburkholderia hiiakae]